MNANPRGHLVLYDGSCGFCRRFVRFVIARDPAGTFRFASLQDPGAQRLLDRYGEEAGNLNTAYVLVDFGSRNERLLDKGRGGLFVLTSLGFPWNALAVFRLLPTALLDSVYDFVARHRGHLSGQGVVEPAPEPEHRSRFLALDDPEAPE